MVKDGSRKKLFFYVTEDWYFVSHRLPLAVAACEAGYDVSVITRVSECGDAIRNAGLRLIPFENSRSGMNPIVELWTLARLAALYMRERPDIVHHVAIKPVLYGSIAARLARVPHRVNALAGLGWLFASSAGLARWIKPAVRVALGQVLRSGITLVQNPDDQRVLIKLGVPEAGIRRIAGSGVDLEQFVPQPEPVGKPTVILPARLLWDKGVGEFVEAARRIRNRGIPARFVLIGAPDEANPSSVPSAQVETWVREGVVECRGWVNNMPEALAQSHIVCLPSYYGEGIPKSLIEAAAAGRPIVTTDMPGCREIVRHDDNGMLVPPRDVERLVASLIRLIGDSGLRRRMGVSGRARAEREFGLRQVIRETLALYAEDGS